MLRSYGFHQEVPEEVWNLFENANELGTKLDYTLEIIDAAMRGDIDLQKKFNLAGYIYSIEKKKELENNRKRKKNIHIDCDLEDYGIPVDKLTDYVEIVDEYEVLANEQEVKYAVNEINKMSNDILVFHKVDIKRCLLQANRGTPESISLLRNLVSENLQVGGLIETILSSGHPLDELL